MSFSQNVGIAEG